jgi:hypothetical protein
VWRHAARNPASFPQYYRRGCWCGFRLFLVLFFFALIHAAIALPVTFALAAATVGAAVGAAVSTDWLLTWLRRSDSNVRAADHTAHGVTVY